MPNQLKVGDEYNPYKRFRGVMIPDPVLASDNLSLGGKVCYGILARFAGEDGECFPSVATIGARMGKKERMARSYLEELEREGFIRRVHRDGQSNTFKFTWHASFDNPEGRQGIAGGAAENCREGAAENCRIRESDLRDSPKRETSDLDYRATHRQKRDEQPEPIPIDLPNGWKTLADLIESILGRSPSQSDIVRVVDATPNRRVAEALKAISESQRRGYTRDHPKGPRSTKWFASTVRNYWKEVERCALPPEAKSVMEPDEVNRLASLFDSMPKAA